MAVIRQESQCRRGDGAKNGSNSRLSPCCKPAPGRAPFERLAATLRDPARYPASDFPQGTALPLRVEMLETHISALFLAGTHTYKIKKPVDLGFLDFTSLAARRFYCEEEVRLNRRTAPSLYLGVVPITRDGRHLTVDGQGMPVEYAVKMRRFPQAALLDRMAKAGTLDGGILDRLATRIAEFHRGLVPAGPERAYASPGQILAAAIQNFDQIDALAPNAGASGALAAMRAWTSREHASLEDVFAARKRDGFVRECHGDLHLGNIVMLEGEPAPFDCIEFNTAFRWIDVMNEVSFLLMDLQAHGLPHLANRFLNRYLAATGDYAGVRLLPFYTVYRAVVRAKVACLRARQPGAGVGSERDFERYLGVAGDLASEARGAVVLMHGLSGSGKTTVAAGLAESMRAIHVRSDVERKRMHSLAPDARTASRIGVGIYAPADTERTYGRLAELACSALAGGYTVVVDATFIEARHRELFRRLARRQGVRFAIVSCSAPDDVLRRRVELRAARGTDASEAGPGVLERQLALRRTFSGHEWTDVIEVDSRDAAALAGLPATLARRLGARAGSRSA